MRSKRTPRILAALALACAAGGVRAQNNPPEALDDFYTTAAGENLSVDAPGVLENDDDLDGDDLTAVLVDPPTSGGVANLFSDGSFEYEPPNGFSGTDRFTYRAFDGTDLSNLAPVEVEVTGAPQFAVFTDEAAFLAALAALSLETTVESYEDDAVWGDVRSTVVGGTFSAPSVTSMGVRWSPNNPTSEVTTSTGPPHTGLWGFYEIPHGNYLDGVDCGVPGNCTDGFVGTASPTLYGVGGWIKGFFGSKIRMFLDGSRVVDFGDNSIVGSAHQFFGVVDPAGFHSFEVRELEGTIDDAKYIWADDFTFGTPAGITLSVIEGPGADVTLQWLGGQPGFSIYAASDPAAVTSPANLLGQTSGRVWIDTPPPGDVAYFRVTSP